METPNEPEMLVTMSIQSESLGSGEIPCVCLGGMQMQTGNADGPGNGEDGSRGLTDGSGAQTDASNVSNKAETASISHGDDVSTHLATGDANHSIEVTDGIESHMDTSNRSMDIPSIENHTRMARNEMQNIRMP